MRAMSHRQPSARGSTGGGERRLVIAIHDVTPAFTAEVRLILRDLDTIGAWPRVLKVVPNAADCGKIQDTPALLRLLQDETRAGSEVVLHGYTHRAAGAYRGRWPTRWRARLFAGTAAEFATLDRRRIVARLEAGRQMLRELGCEPRGFCAPGWLAPPEIAAILRECGFHYYVGMATLHDLQHDRRRWLPWTGYMGAGPWHERLIRTTGAALLTMRPRAPVVKVFLHPQDVPRSADYRRMLRVLARLVRERQPITYEQLLDR